MTDSSLEPVGSEKPELTHYWVEPTADTIDRNLELYQIAYDEGTRTLDDQALEIANARTRAVQFLAFVGAATAFLAGTILRSADRHLAFYCFSGVASFFAAVSLISVALLLNPRSAPLYHRIEPRILLKDWIEREVPAPSKAGMLRELALHFEDWRALNEAPLEKVRRLYFVSIVAGALQLATWATLAWIAG